MNKIIKILNHNAIIVHDQTHNDSLLVMKTGVGFGRKINEQIPLDGQETIYHIKLGTKHSKEDALLNKLDPQFIEMSHEILSLYFKEFDTLDQEKLLPLADHIAFAIQRIKSKMSINNPFTNEIRLLYPEEWQVAAKSREIIFNRLGVLINENEIGYITLHLHSSQEISKDHGFVVAMIVNQSIRDIEREYDVVVDTHSLSYSRLMMHMKYMIARLSKGEKISLDMEDYTKASIPTAYDLAKEIVSKISTALETEVPKIEVGYLAMHMDRILSDSPRYQELRKNTEY